MNKLSTLICIFFSGVGAVVGSFLGGVDGLIYTLLAFVVTDYITGVAVAIVEKKLNSTIGFKGLFKKVLIFALVGIANLIDTKVIGSGSVLRGVTIFFYLSNEGISLLENIGKLGMPFPKKLKAVFEQLKKEGEKDE